MTRADVERSVALHLQVLDMEFLSRFGPRFMRVYYDAWMSSAGSLHLVAVHDDEVVGVLLGATDPAAHARAMVREHGFSLAVALATGAARRPRLARDLVTTRALRYARGLGRLVVARWRRRPATLTPLVKVGEITHVLVDPAARGRGVGRELVEDAVRASRAARVREIELVTPPDMDAQHFYRSLGWTEEGALTSRSGESFLRFRLRLD